MARKIFDAAPLRFFPADSRIDAALLLRANRRGLSTLLDATTSRVFMLSEASMRIAISGVVFAFDVFDVFRDAAGSRREA